MATTKVKFISGHPQMRDYTPGSAVTAGDVVVVKNTTQIAHKDIAANAKGSLGISGGIYEAPITAAGTGTAIADGDPIYWDASGQVATLASGSGSNELLGTAVETATATATTIRFLHQVPATASA